MQQKSKEYRVIVGFVRFVMKLFFREVAVEGAEKIPTGVGGLIVSWHPNGLIDPALILSNFPGRIVFGARHGLLEWPIVGPLMRRIGTIPIYRTSDKSNLSKEERRAANQSSLAALADELASGSFSALFPEGLSHDDPHLAQLKTGAARLFYQAYERTPTGQPTPVIIPVGLHYERKAVFRSRVLISFHDPIELPNHLNVRPSEDDEPAVVREKYRALTDIIESTLINVVHATEDWQLHYLFHRTRKLMRAERADRAGSRPAKPDIAERERGFSRVWHAYRQRSETHPEEVAELKSEVVRYDRILTALKMEDDELGGSNKLGSPLLVVLILLQLIAVYLLFPPIIVVGYLLNGIPYMLLRRLSPRLGKAEKDKATVKIFGGALLYPLSWGVWAFVAARTSTRLHEAFPTIPDVPIIAAVVTVVLGITGGIIALVYKELAADTIRAARVRLTRRAKKSTVAAMREVRSNLYLRFTELGEGLNLPGEVAPDGRVLPESSG